jgi:hypothetical protein
MEQPPCQKEREAYLAAMEEWNIADQAYLAFLPSDATETNDKPEPLSRQELENLTRADRQRQLAYKKYRQALEEYTNCIHGK